MSDEKRLSARLRIVKRRRRNDGAIVTKDHRSLAYRKRRNEQRALHKLVMPKLRGQDSEQCLILFTWAVQARATAPHQSANGRGGKDSDTSQSFAREVIADPRW